MTEEALRAFRGTTLLGFDVVRSSYGFFPHFLVEVEEAEVDAKLEALAQYQTYADKYYFERDLLRATMIRHGALAERRFPKVRFLRGRAPADLGPGEIRYMRGADDVVLARRPITLKAAKVTLKAPAKSPLGEPVHVEWTGPNNRNDYLTIVPKGTPDGREGNSGWTASGSPIQLNPPDTAGPCEIRYVSGQGDKVLARIPIDIIAAP